MALAAVSGFAVLPHSRFALTFSQDPTSCQHLDADLNFLFSQTHQVTVSGLESLVDTLSDLTWRGLPGAISALTGCEMVVSDDVLPWSHAITYGICAPVFSVTFFPRDMLMTVM
jgi:hypothetical protein